MLYEVITPEDLVPVVPRLDPGLEEDVRQRIAAKDVKVHLAEGHRVNALAPGRFWIAGQGIRQEWAWCWQGRVSPAPPDEASIPRTTVQFRWREGMAHYRNNFV